MSDLDDAFQAAMAAVSSSEGVETRMFRDGPFRAVVKSGGGVTVFRGRKKIGHWQVSPPSFMKTAENASVFRHYATTAIEAARLQDTASKVPWQAVSLVIARERLDRQGYTRSGRYFGVGEKLWSWSSDSHDGFVRAASKPEARRKAIEELSLKGVR